MRPVLDGQLKPRNKATAILGALATLVTLGILVCTLWPFDPFPPNHVSWIGETNGIRFGWQGVVLGQLPMDSVALNSSDKPCSLEILLKPVRTDFVGTALDIYQPDNPMRFRVRQYRDGLIIAHDVRTKEGKLRRVKIDLDHGLHSGNDVLVTLTSGQRGTSVYLDGKLKETHPNFRITTGDVSGQIILGTAPVDSEPWSGEIHGLAIYSKELTPNDVWTSFLNWKQGNPSDTVDLTDCLARYRFDERSGREIHNRVENGLELEIPASFRVPSKAFLQLPWNEFEWSRSYLDDVLRNIAGFVPFGFFVCAYLSMTRHRHSAVLLTILAGSTLSLCVEVLQAYIPQRTSGTTDIVTNTLGTVVGVILARSTTVQEFLKKSGWLPSTEDSRSMAN